MEFQLFDLGVIDFKEAWDFQKQVHSRVKQGKLTSALILCQHKPVITLGRRSKAKNILATQTDLKRLGIKTYFVERGGDATYHGPGQICAYPIIDLACFRKDINWFLRQLETLFINLIGDFGVKVNRIPGSTGIWFRTKKIASIGIAIRNWITFHGIALNVKQSDLVNFSLIHPCGQNITMTSMESILGESVEINTVKERLIRGFTL